MLSAIIGWLIFVAVVTALCCISGVFLVACKCNGEDRKYWVRRIFIVSILVLLAFAGAAVMEINKPEEMPSRGKETSYLPHNVPFKVIAVIGHDSGDIVVVEAENNGEIYYFRPTSGCAIRLEKGDIVTRNGEGHYKRIPFRSKSSSGEE